jgi:hypothetical protein
MIKHEAFGLREKISEQHDLELARKIRELDEFKKQTKTTPVLEVPIPEGEPDNTESLFSQLANATVRPINIQQWSA